jgi:hypothetical protein
MGVTGRSPATGRVSDRLPITHADVRQMIALLPLCIAGLFVGFQALTLFSAPGVRDTAGIVKGHDFVHFYALGSLARTGDYLRMYDQRALTAEMWRLVPESQGASFIPAYGPVFAAAFIPFAALSYVTAVHTWLTCTAIAYALSAWIMARMLPGIESRIALWLLVALNPAFWVTIVMGQTSALSLAAVAAGWWLLERNRPLVAGLVLGMLLLKPSLGVTLFGVFAIGRAWRLVGGMAGSFVIQTAIGLALAGVSGTVAHIETVSALVIHGGLHVSLPQDLHSFAGFLRLLLGETRIALMAYAVAGLVCAVLAGTFWRTDAPLRRRYGVAMLGMVLAAPHLYMYDLLLLTPTLAVAWEAGAPPNGDRRLLALSALAWLSPLAGLIALATRVQGSVIVLFGLLLLLRRPSARTWQPAAAGLTRGALPRSGRADPIQKGSSGSARGDIDRRTAH